MEEKSETSRSEVLTSELLINDSSLIPAEQFMEHEGLLWLYIKCQYFNADWVDPILEKTRWGTIQDEINSTIFPELRNTYTTSKGSGKSKGDYISLDESIYKKTFNDWFKIISPGFFKNVNAYKKLYEKTNGQTKRLKFVDQSSFSAGQAIANSAEQIYNVNSETLRSSTFNDPTKLSNKLSNSDGVSSYYSFSIVTKADKGSNQTGNPYNGFNLAIKSLSDIMKKETTTPNLMKDKETFLTVLKSYIIFNYKGVRIKHFGINSSGDKIHVYDIRYYYDKGMLMFQLINPKTNVAGYTGFMLSASDMSCQPINNWNAKSEGDEGQAKFSWYAPNAIQPLGMYTSVIITGDKSASVGFKLDSIMIDMIKGSPCTPQKPISMILEEQRGLLVVSNNFESMISNNKSLVNSTVHSNQVLLEIGSRSRFHIVNHLNYQIMFMKKNYNFEKYKKQNLNINKGIILFKLFLQASLNSDNSILTSDSDNEITTMLYNIFSRYIELSRINHDNNSFFTDFETQVILPLSSELNQPGIGNMLLNSYYSKNYDNQSNENENGNLFKDYMLRTQKRFLELYERKGGSPPPYSFDVVMEMRTKSSGLLDELTQNIDESFKDNGPACQRFAGDSGASCAQLLASAQWKNAIGKIVSQVINDFSMYIFKNNINEDYKEQFVKYVKNGITEARKRIIPEDHYPHYVSEYVSSRLLAPSTTDPGKRMRSGGIISNNISTKAEGSTITKGNVGQYANAALGSKKRVRAQLPAAEPDTNIEDVDNENENENGYDWGENNINEDEDENLTFVGIFKNSGGKNPRNESRLSILNKYFVTTRTQVKRNNPAIYQKFLDLYKSSDETNKQKFIRLLANEFKSKRIPWAGKWNSSKFQNLLEQIFLKM